MPNAATVHPKHESRPNAERNCVACRRAGCRRCTDPCMHAACFLGDEALETDIVAALQAATRGIAEQPAREPPLEAAAPSPQKRGREPSKPASPWQAPGGHSAIAALARAREALRRAALAGCP